MVNSSDYVSKRAQFIDESIYFFVEDNEIELSGEDLVKLVSSQAV